MIAIDASAIVAILAGEPDAEVYARAIENAENRVISVASYLECVMVLKKHGLSRQEISDWLMRCGIAIEPTTVVQAHFAAEAFDRFGRGSGHKAKLNFGDCLSYALARHLNAPLLFKGDDFIHTDLRRA